MNLTFTQVYPAIALATVVNGFALAAAWKANRVEAARGEPPWWFILGSLLYTGSLAGYHYLTKADPVAGYFSIFMATLGGQAMGLLFFMTAYRTAFPNRPMALGERLFSIFATAMFAFIMIGPLLV